jgi:4'-phosphopantetheinyl transferase
VTGFSARPGAFPALGRGEVHVWRTALDLDPPRVAALAESLSPDERDRAARFHFERDRVRFTVARGVLRALLGRYLHLPAPALAFDYGAHGKPALAAAAVARAAWESPGAEVRFNVSHSAGVALCAVTRGRDVGVDVEGLRADFATDEIAERFFSPAERAALRALPAEARCAAFFACWTRKEAYIKARGLGLSLALDAFDVSLAPGAPAALLATRDEAGARDRWLLRALDPGPDLAGAVVAEGHDWTLHCWTWP